ncbi:MAG: hypothetical protein J2P57_08570 [Acidimicrobiaceae bacterium]|nr:hypothetical protein [Acidimicrobiaceae bacterium]
MAAAIGLALLAWIGLTACGSGEATEAESPAATQTETQAPAEVSETDKADSPEQVEWAEEQDAGSVNTPTGTVQAGTGPVAFGGTVVWPDGLSVTASEPTPVPAPREVFGYGQTGHPNYAVVTVTFHNDGTKPYSFSDFNTAVISGSQEGSTIWDGERYDSDPPSADLLPGNSVSFELALNYAASDLTLQINRDYGESIPASFLNF